MLNEFVHIVGCHRKSAVRLLGPQEGFMADSDPYLQLAEMINKSDHHILGMPDHQAQKGHVRQSLIDSGPLRCYLASAGGLPRTNVRIVRRRRVPRTPGIRQFF